MTTRRRRVDGRAKSRGVGFEDGGGDKQRDKFREITHTRIQKQRQRGRERGYNNAIQKPRL